jgi:hypothetical protein
MVEAEKELSGDGKVTHGQKTISLTVYDYERPRKTLAYKTPADRFNACVASTELMPSLVGGDTETVCSKLKSRNRFSKPNLETLPKRRQVRQHRQHVSCKPTPVTGIFLLLDLILIAFADGSGRHTHDSLECTIEGGFGVVADPLRDFRQRIGALT